MKQNWQKGRMMALAGVLCVLSCKGQMNLLAYPSHTAHMRYW